jgi:hypothetical protein
MRLGKKLSAVSVRRWKIVAMAGLVALTLPALAQSSRVFREGNTWVEETTGTLPAGREFRALTDVGSVQVQGNASQVMYVVRKRSTEPTEAGARKQFDQLRVTASKVGDAVVLEGRMLSRGMNHVAADFMVQIPRLTQLVRAETLGGAMSLSSIQGTVMAKTGGGAVKIDDMGGPVRVFSGGGAMEVGNVNSDLFLQTGGGAISVQRVTGQLFVKTGGGRVKIGSSGPANVETGAGNIEVDKCTGEMRATSGGGNLNFGEIGGNLTAETSGGSVRLGSAQGDVRVITGGGTVELWKVGQGAYVETGGGAMTVQFVGGRNQFHDSYLNTAMGNVLVYLPRDLPVSVHASAEMASGEGIKSAFPGLTISSEGGQYGPKSMSAEGQLNGGGAVLRVRTTIGQITIKPMQ